MTGFKKGDKHQNTPSQLETEGEDLALFQNAMQGVTPLAADNKVHAAPSQPKAKKLKHLQMQPESHLQFDFNVHEADNTQSVGTDEYLMFHRKGLRLQELSRLKKGEFQVEAVLDLHGLIVDIADQQLKAFIHQAWSKKCRFLLIIHGKGYNSEAGHPILKNLVNQRLQQYPKVLAFCSAQPKDGSTGAVYVFLKAH